MVEAVSGHFSREIFEIFRIFREFEAIIVIVNEFLIFQLINI